MCISLLVLARLGIGLGMLITSGGVVYGAKVGLFRINFTGLGGAMQDSEQRATFIIALGIALTLVSFISLMILPQAALVSCL